MSVAVSAALALNLLLWSGACCASVLCKMQQLGEPSDKGNPYGALHNSHMQNDTGGFSLFLDVGCFLFSCCCRLMLCLFKWILQFTSFFFPKSQESCVHILFNFQVPLYTSYMAHLFKYTNSCHSYPGLETFGILSRNICAVYYGQTWVMSVCVSG